MKTIQNNLERLSKAELRQIFWNALSSRISKKLNRLNAFQRQGSISHEGAKVTKVLNPQSQNREHSDRDRNENHEKIDLQEHVLESRFSLGSLLKTPFEGSPVSYFHLFRRPVRRSPAVRDVGESVLTKANAFLRSLEKSLFFAFSPSVKSVLSVVKIVFALPLTLPLFWRLTPAFSSLSSNLKSAIVLGRRRKPISRLASSLLILFILLIPVNSLFSAPPAWWTTQNVLDTTKPANDYAAVNQGQLKAIAKKAITEMNTKLPGGAGTDLNALLTTWSQANATRNDYTAVNLGQVKALAKKFYDRLNAVGLNTPYPWSAATTDDKDYAAANIGQVKNVFSFAIPNLSLLPPTTLTATAGNAQVLLSWTPVTGATGYRVQRSTTNGSGYEDFTGNTVTHPTVTLTNTSLTNGTTYYYVVQAAKGTLYSANSPQASATPIAALLPPPTVLPFTTSNGQVTLNWSAVAGAAGYRIQRSTTSGGGYVNFANNTTTASATTLTDSTATNGTTYYYVIQTYNGTAYGGNSSQVTATPIAVATGLSEVAGTSQVVLNWAATTGATTYRVQRSTTNGSGYDDFANNTVSAATTTLTDSTVTNGTTYYYVVQANNGATYSGNSNQVTATPMAAPLGVTPSSGNAQVTISWTAVTGATSYKVQRSTTANAPYLDFTNNTVTNPVVTLTDATVTNGTKYYYVVYAVNTTGISSKSLEVNATPSNLLNTLPSVSGFESLEGFILGGLNNQLGWLDSTLLSTIQNLVSAEGTQAVRLPGKGAKMQKSFISTQSSVTVEVKIQIPSTGTFAEDKSDFPAAISSLISYDPDRGLLAYNGTGADQGTWMVVTGTPVAGQWVTIQIVQNFATKKWALSLNGVEKLNNLGFRNNGVLNFSKFTVENGTADEIFVDRFSGQ